MINLNRVAGYRVALKLKQSDMANKLNISRQAYSEKERGNVPFKDSEKIFLKELFKQVDSNVTIDLLFFG
ncbi:MULTISPECIES: helix-turn-helix transcriptional regulator [Vagococcus]|uniref:helix-turn-helix transcriptional regulator n=1 Tax=Vagococcus sp. TaxID=1933889 RepID=UPI000B36411C|nr:MULTISPECIES: hypothetical protein [Vagococcus]HCM89314.1 transcriptional regulator [Vagococcus sp.]